MRFSSTIDNVHSVEWGLSVNQAYLFSWIYSLPSWADKVSYENDLYFYASRHKAITEMPLLTDKPDTVYRYYKQLEAIGLIRLIRINEKDYVTLTDKGKLWNDTEDRYKTSIRHSDNFPTPGNASENNSENFPTNNNTITNTDNLYNTKKGNGGFEKNASPPKQPLPIEEGTLAPPKLQKKKAATKNPADTVWKSVAPAAQPLKQDVKESMMEIYNRSWEANCEFENLRTPKEIFEEWKSLVDLVTKKFDIIWNMSRFITPPEYQKFKLEYQLTPQVIDNVFGRICSAGILPQHNLYWRLGEFLKTNKTKTNGQQENSTNKTRSQRSTDAQNQLLDSIFSKFPRIFPGESGTEN